MRIQRKSVFSGINRVREINVNPKDYKLWKDGILNMEDAMGYLSSDDRDFILSGMIKDEWKRAFSEDIQKIVADQL